MFSVNKYLLLFSVFNFQRNFIRQNYFFYKKLIFFYEMVKTLDIKIWNGIMRAFILYLIKVFFAFDAKFLFQLKLFKEKKPIRNLQKQQKLIK